MSFKAKIKIRVDSQLIDFTGAKPEGPGEEPPRSRFTDIGEGTVRTRGGIVTVSRKLITGASFDLSFAKNDPGIVTIRRGYERNGTPMLLVVEEGRRHICLNSAHGSPIEITTTCRKLDNRIMTTGKIIIEYAVELHGFRVEKTFMTVDINKITAEGN